MRTKRHNYLKLCHDTRSLIDIYLYIHAHKFICQHIFWDFRDLRNVSHATAHVKIVIFLDAMAFSCTDIIFNNVVNVRIPVFPAMPTTRVHYIIRFLLSN